MTIDKEKITELTGRNKKIEPDAITRFYFAEDFFESCFDLQEQNNLISSCVSAVRLLNKLRKLISSWDNCSGRSGGEEFKKNKPNFCNCFGDSASGSSSVSLVSTV